MWILKIKTAEGWKKVANYRTRTLAEKEGYAYLLLPDVTRFEIVLSSVR